MIDINVKKNLSYKELIIQGFESEMSTGLLDEIEAAEVAKQLISAAEELLPLDYECEIQSLIQIRMQLDNEYSSKVKSPDN